MRLPDWNLANEDVGQPTVDDVDFRSLYQKSHYPVHTQDGWTLCMSRYQPVPQTFHQPLYGIPLLLVHGFSQNRHTWTSGQFVKNLLFFGLDIHVLELRGHGRSGIRAQYEWAEQTGSPLPGDVDYGWDIDSYLLEDLPAAIREVKARTGSSRIFYCGHSMGGILGYGYAGLNDDLEGLITIGAPADLGRGFPLLRAAAMVAPALAAALDLGFASYNFEQKAVHASRSAISRALNRLKLDVGKRLEPGPDPKRLEYRFVPVDQALKALERLLVRAEEKPLFEPMVRAVNWLSNPQRARSQDVRWLLREGGEREPRKVLEQFIRWTRNGEMVCYRTGYDFKEGFAKIDIPMAIIFGDLDPLASIKSTRSVYRAAKSEYLLWRPVKGNSHIELTMGHDIRQICYDIKNLIEYSRSHRTKVPTLPRVQ
jgi:pimeloyl-ACP methyl ester carboxylesterase